MAKLEVVHTSGRLLPACLQFIVVPTLISSVSVHRPTHPLLPRSWEMTISVKVEISLQGTPSSYSTPTRCGMAKIVLVLLTPAVN